MFAERLSCHTATAITRILLSSSLSLIFVVSAHATALNPLDFVSLGAWPGGNVTVDTTNLTVTGIAGTGVIETQSSAPDIAVFSFDGSASVDGLVTVTGSRPAAILFQGPATISGTIDVRLAGSRPQNTGPGAGIAGDIGHGGSGGSFGGVGGDSGLGTGNAYGNLLQELEVGSGGGEGWTLGNWPGGAGGGGLELGALGLLDLGGSSIVANGFDGTDSGGNGAGGGSGGAVFLHSFSVSFDGVTSLTADGGDGGNGFSFSGSGGGGGRIAVLTNDNGAFIDGGAIISANGGLAGSANQGGGQQGLAGNINTSTTSSGVGLGPLIIDPDSIGATDVIQDPSGSATLLVNPLADPFDLGADDLAVGNTSVGELLISNGGTVSDLDGIIGNLTGSVGTVTVTGAGSTWNNTRSLLLGILGAGTLNIENQGSVNNDHGYISSNPDSTGIATVTGTGSTWTNRESLWVGVRGMAGELQIADGGSVTSVDGNIGNDTGSIGVVTVTGAGSTWANGMSLLVGISGTGTLNVEDQGVVTSHNGFIGDNHDSTGTVTITGIGSQWMMTGNLVIADIGTGTLNIESSGTVAVSGLVNLGSNATVNISSGTLRFGDVNASTGSFNFTGGAVNDTSDLTLSDGDGLDSLKSLTFGKILQVDGALTLNSPVELNQGILKAGSLTNVPNLIWRRGILELLGGNTSEPIDIPSHGKLTGTGTISGRVTAITSSTILATGPLALGDATVVNGFYSNSTLNANDQIITLDDANDAVLDSGAFVDLGAAGTGVISADNGLTLDFGGNITGHGTVNTPNNPAKPLINNGHIAGNSGTEPVTLTGYVKGVGTLNDVNITGTDAPGFSTAVVSRGSVSYNGTLEIELGGTSPGIGYDQLNHILGTGIAVLGGTLSVEVINGFDPSVGDSFDLVIANGGVTGEFSAFDLPSLNANEFWQLDYMPEVTVLKVLPVGDMTGDGLVNLDDVPAFVLALTNPSVFGTSNLLLFPEDAGDVNDDGQFDLGDISAFSALFDESASVQPVPEPSTLLLAIVLLMGIAIQPRRRQ